MDGLSKLEAQEQIMATVKTIVETIHDAIPEEWSKDQVASVFQLYLSLIR